MSAVLRFLFYACFIRPLALIVLGLNVRHRERLPLRGPLIVAANHNSHLDALVLASLFPLRMLQRVRPVAAADYFFRNRLLAWFALRVVGIIPIQRKEIRREDDPLRLCEEALEKAEILILFPEGQRGAPERMERFKNGVAHLVQLCPETPVVPVFLHGLGKALPRGEGLLVPFFCDVFVGEALQWEGDRVAFMRRLEESIRALGAEGEFSPWE